MHHVGIVSCVAMIFVIGLMLHMGEMNALTNELAWRDYSAVYFCTLIWIIIHGVLQEYVIDKISKRLHLTELHLSRFNETAQLVLFYAVSFIWGTDVILREGYIADAVLLWKDYPIHPITFSHKLFFIVQLAYYLHMLAELYFQNLKKEDQQPWIIQSIVMFSLIALAYCSNFHRIGLVLLTIHYVSEVFVLIQIFDRDKKYVYFKILSRIVFVFTRFTTMVLSVLTFYYKIENCPFSLMIPIAIYALQAYLLFPFIKDVMKDKKRDSNLPKAGRKK